MQTNKGKIGSKGLKKPPSCVVILTKSFRAKCQKYDSTPESRLGTEMTTGMTIKNPSKMNGLQLSFMRAVDHIVRKSPKNSSFLPLQVDYFGNLG